LPPVVQVAPDTDGPVSQETELGTTKFRWQHGPATGDPAVQPPVLPSHSSSA